MRSAAAAWPPATPSAKELGVVVQLAAGLAAAPGYGAGQRRGRRAARARSRDDRTRAKAGRSCACRCRPSCATGSTRIEIEGEQSAGGVLLIDERWRRRPVGIAAAPNSRRPAAAQRELLPRARARPVHRNPPRPRARSAEARAGGADLFRCRPGFARRGGRDPQMDRQGRRLLLRFAGPHLAEQRRQAAAGAAAPRRPHDRRRAVLGAAGPARPVRAATARSPGWRSRPT